MVWSTDAAPPAPRSTSTWALSGPAFASPRRAALAWYFRGGLELSRTLRGTLIAAWRAWAPADTSWDRASWRGSAGRELGAPAHGLDRRLGQERSTQIAVVLQRGRQSIEYRGGSPPKDLRSRPAAARLLDARGRGADSPLRRRRLESVKHAEGLGHLAFGLDPVALAESRLGEALVTEGEVRALAGHRREPAQLLQLRARPVDVLASEPLLAQSQA